MMGNRVGAICAGLALAACGGGGGTSTAPTEPISSTLNNVAPIVATAVSDQSADVGFEFSLDLAGTFSDADNDTLTITADFGADAKGLSLSGSVISGTPNSTGTVAVTCTATDPDGESVSDSFEIAVGIDQSAIAAAFNGAIDLESLANYADQPVPDYITKLNDGGNPITDAGATLGRV
ncbi:MAG: putative Ig domain-containing protein, partial [Pseudomonadota bacterium]